MNNQSVDCTVSELKILVERMGATIPPDTKIRIVATDQSIKIIRPDGESDPDFGLLVSWRNRI